MFWSNLTTVNRHNAVPLLSTFVSFNFPFLWCACTSLHILRCVLVKCGHRYVELKLNLKTQWEKSEIELHGIYFPWRPENKFKDSSQNLKLVGQVPLRLWPQVSALSSKSFVFDQTLALALASARAPAGFFSRSGQIRHLGTKVPQRSLGMEPRWENNA